MLTGFISDCACADLGRSHPKGARSMKTTKTRSIPMARYLPFPTVHPTCTTIIPDQHLHLYPTERRWASLTTSKPRNVTITVQPLAAVIDWPHLHPVPVHVKQEWGEELPAHRLIPSRIPSSITSSAVKVVLKLSDWVGQAVSRAQHSMFLQPLDRAMDEQKEDYLDHNHPISPRKKSYRT